MPDALRAQVGGGSARIACKLGTGSLTNDVGGADTDCVRQHCTQCLSEVYGNGRQAPTGELLCQSCHSALWGPSASEELRSLVRLHMGRPRNGRNGSLNGRPVATAR
jgi:hypothetical protein